jgi:hypothetical protein
LVIDQVHRTVGHMGTRITKNYACRYFWWPDLESDIKSFCESCSMCQATKTSNQRPQGLLHSLPMPTKPWSSIGMDFVGPFPLVDNFDYVWVVLCRLTSLVHFIPLRTTMMASQLAPLFITLSASTDYRRPSSATVTQNSHHYFGPKSIDYLALN